MTIKKRLFISNILMIIIPALLAVIMLAGCLFLFLVSTFPDAEYKLGLQEELTEIRYKAVELAADWLDATDLTQKNDLEAELLQLSEENQLMIQIKDGRNTVLQFGTDTVSSQKQLEQSLAALNGNGTVSNGAFDLFGAQLSLNGKE